MREALRGLTTRGRSFLAAALAAADFNRDGRINAIDYAIVRDGAGRTLQPFTAAVAAAPAAARFVAPFSERSVGSAATTRRSAWDLLQSEEQG